MSWLDRITGGRLMMILYGAATVALLGYWMQISTLHHKIDKLQTAAAKNLLIRDNLQQTIDSQSESIAIIIKNSQAAQNNNDKVLAEYRARKPEVITKIIRERAKLTEAVNNTDCGKQALPESVKNAFNPH